MKYKNTKTGAIINSPCVIKGKNWIEVEEVDTKSVKKTSNKKNDKQESER